VKTVPNSKKHGVERIGEDDFKVKVDAKAEGGKANRRLVEIVAEFFQVPKSSVRIVKGFKSRSKIIEIKNF
jgi:hypothetical protein